MASKFYKTALSNGLTILGEANEANVSAAIGFFVKTGARDEKDPESGVSHFLEHMLFMGSKHVDGRGFDKPENRPTNLQVPLERK